MLLLFKCALLIPPGCCIFRVHEVRLISWCFPPDIQVPRRVREQPILKDLKIALITEGGILWRGGGSEQSLWAISTYKLAPVYLALTMYTPSATASSGEQVHLRHWVLKPKKDKKKKKRSQERSAGTTKSKKPAPLPKSSIPFTVGFVQPEHTLWDHDTFHCKNIPPSDPTRLMKCSLNEIYPFWKVTPQTKWTGKCLQSV